LWKCHLKVNRRNRDNTPSPWLLFFILPEFCPFSCNQWARYNFHKSQYLWCSISCLQLFCIMNFSAIFVFYLKGFFVCVLFCSLFKDRILLESPGWLRTCDPSISDS
jgi:hypothetical protein